MKRLIAVLLAVLMLSGCQLASEEQKGNRMEDKLVGVFVTFNHLDLEFDIEGWLRDNPGALKDGGVTLEPGEGMEYGGRLWAEVTEEGWRFPEHEGIVMGQMWREDYWVGFSTEGFCEHETSSHRTDTLDSIEEEGTVCFPAGAEVMLCANPVYMTPEGTYYAVQGNSFHSQLEDGSMSQSVSDERTWTVEGETHTYRAQFTTTVQGVTLADTVVMVWMSGDHRELGRAEYVPGELPEALTPPAEAAYLIVEEVTGGESARKLYQPGDEPVRVFYQGEQPWCLPEFVEIQWT